MRSDCILHKQKGNKDGYASTNRKVNGVVRNLLMHRVKFCDFHGISIDDIDGLEIRHTCDNPRCINPLHLVTGTHADNMGDMRVRGRAASGEKSGAAKLTWDSVREIRNMAGCGHSHTHIAELVGVNHRTIGAIVRGETWKE